MTDFLAANRLNWDDRAKLHATDTTGAPRLPLSFSLKAVKRG